MGRIGGRKEGDRDGRVGRRKGENRRWGGWGDIHRQSAREDLNIQSCQPAHKINDNIHVM